ncbi:phosphate acyltransferase [Longibacter salinarum]|uniref:Phosphate acyltransferase n=1 Tax=Longibacter salinarum TaxID=1850348 RepID=A0A2A8CVA6_9BACT|nr:phosphate acyltransferase PlsX [Longibacter salinarum]PEN12540.1 phosphate acyltransferase [Longibacter salinarum]
MALCIAVDAMGGDNAPNAVIQGAISALESADDPLQILLFGPTDRVQPLLDEAGVSSDLPLKLVDAPDVIEMTDSPAAAVKKKRESSIHLGLGAHKKGDADAFISAGNTGAVMATSMFTLGRISGVERPSIAGYFPTLRGFSIVVDIGTNVDCRPEHLVQFARMASVYTQHVLGTENPSVGLLNIGEEPGKGNEQVKAAFDLLGEAEDINFKGNVEGSDLLDYAADIIVCDGFVGNILLKFGESMTTVLKKMTAQEMERQQLPPEDQQVVAGVLSEVSKGFDADHRGGAPLLGVDGNVMIGHGRSNADAIEQMIHATADLVRSNVVNELKDAFGE